MKIYTFRIIRDAGEVGLYDENDMTQKYPLYAWTTKKGIAKRFILQRNMNKFIQITFSKDDLYGNYNQWVRINHSYELDYYELETYINRNTKKQDIQFAEIVATDSEMSILNEVVESGSIIADIIPYYIPIEIFSDEVQEDMEAIGLKDAMMLKMMSNPMGSSTLNNYDVSNMREEVFDKLGMFEDFEINRIDARITIDQLAAFIRLYKDLLSSEFAEMIDIKVDK